MQEDKGCGSGKSSYTALLPLLSTPLPAPLCGCQMWLGQGCPDAAGNLMDAADGCDGAWKCTAHECPWESSAIPASNHDPAAVSLMEDARGVH